MKIWDVHCHFPVNWQDPSEDPSVRLDNMAKHLERAGVVRACLLSGGRWGPGYEKAIEYARRYPELFLPVAVVDPEVTGRQQVWELYQMGYRGLKMIGVRRDYDCPDYFPMYAAAEALNMPVLLHMGVIGGPVDYSRTHPRRDPAAAQRLQMMAARRMPRDVSAMRMHPFHMDTLANNFPALKLIGAHLGGTGNYDASASVARWRPNVFFDLSGGETIEDDGEQRGYIAGAIGVEKLVWGSDCPAEEVQDHVDRFVAMFERLNLSEDEAERIWFQNAAEMYGEAEPAIARE
jgi:uncharacterized protein